MATYSGKSYEFLFNDYAAGISEDAFEALRHKNVFKYRTRIIYCGDTAEIEIFPIWNTKTEARAAKANTTKEAQAAVNERNAKKALYRKINTNFTKDDFHITLTYRNHELPDEPQALKDMQNFIRRVRHHYKKRGLPTLKYVYVIEFADGDGRRKRIHHHVIINGGAARNEIKALWHFGRVGVDELEPEDGSLEGLARYITKQPNQTKQTKRWQASRNLKPYTKKRENNHVMSKRQAERMAKDHEAAAPLLFGKLMPDYVLDGCTVKRSKFVAGVYINARLHLESATTTKRGARNNGAN